MPLPFATADLVTMLAAIPAAALGGALFLQGVLGVAAWLRLPKLLVATTLAAFATSSPELAVSILAAMSGKPGIGLGDALGSNVFNIGLILGVSLLFGSIKARLADVKRDYVLALGVPVFTLVLVRDGVLSRVDGVLLLGTFVGWLSLVIRQATRLRRNAVAAEGLTVRPVHAWLAVLVGFAALILAGRLFVSGASGLASAFGVHPYLLGATIVAVGTSLPELVTVMLSRVRGHDDVGLGTLLGSNLFNGLAIVGIAAMIHPIRVPVGEVAVALTSGVLTTILILPFAGELSRRRGLALVTAYAGFVFLTGMSSF